MAKIHVKAAKVPLKISALLLLYRLAFGVFKDPPPFLIALPIRLLNAK